jgi:hypothetical protein
MGASSAMYTYVKIVVVLMYFIEERRIDAFEGEMQPSDWSELSEKQCARAKAYLAAAERIAIQVVVSVSVILTSVVRQAVLYQNHTVLSS